jgi:DNA-binding ferritin-like protein
MQRHGRWLRSARQRTSRVCHTRYFRGAHDAARRYFRVVRENEEFSLAHVDYHLLLDQQSEQIFAATDAIAERVRKIGGTTLRSIGQIRCLHRVLDNDAEYVTPLDIVAELRDDNKQLAAHMRETHGLCDEHGDVASASLLENWIAEAERWRTWFLFEVSRSGEPAGHADGA